MRKSARESNNGKAEKKKSLNEMNTKLIKQDVFFALFLHFIHFVDLFSDMPHFIQNNNSKKANQMNSIDTL